MAGMLDQQLVRAGLEIASWKTLCEAKTRTAFSKTEIQSGSVKTEDSIKLRDTVVDGKNQLLRTACSVQLRQSVSSVCSDSGGLDEFVPRITA